jgi:ketosteroid isomerase-like protein
MKKALPILLIFSASVAALAFQQRSVRSSDLDALVNSERAFARMAAERNTREAFLAFMSDESIVFSPGPSNGKKTWTARPVRPGLLSWEPIYADISAAGDMGYDTGPWEFRPNGAADKPVAFGNFMTIWKKQADGTFKFALDLGISNPQPTSAQALSFSGTKAKAKEKASERDVEAGRERLLDVERAFAKASAGEGALKAYLSYMADEVRLLHEGKFPFIGKQAARTEVEARAGVMNWQPEKADISRSIDMGYTYGTYDWKAADGKADEKGYYVHIWKRQPDGKWRVVMEVLNPLPKEKS